MEQPIEIPDVNGETSHAAEVRELFAANSDRTLRPKDVRLAFECIPDTYVGPLLARLRDNGEIRRVAYGKY